MLTAVAPVQAEKGDDDNRPWGVDVLQAYMDKQLGKECAPCLPDSPQDVSVACTECCHFADNDCSSPTQHHWAWSLSPAVGVRPLFSARAYGCSHGHPAIDLLR